MATPNVEYLREHGPATAAELPRQVRARDKQAGLHVVRLSGRHGSRTPMGGRPTAVYYLPAHPPETVLRRYLDENPSLVDAKTRQGMLELVGGHGRTWRDAAREVVDASFGPPDRQRRAAAPRDPGETEACPFCGTTVAKGTLLAHIASDCPGTPE